MTTQNTVTAVSAIDAEIAFMRKRLADLTQSRELLTGSKEERPEEGNGHKISIKAKAKKIVSVVTKEKGKVKPGKVDKAAIISAISKAERMSTGEVAAAYFGGDKEVASKYLEDQGEVAYHKRGRGGYWTLAEDEEASNE